MSSEEDKGCWILENSIGFCYGNCWLYGGVQ